MFKYILIVKTSSQEQYCEYHSLELATVSNAVVTEHIPDFRGCMLLVEC